jgi:hypothetical protein
VTGRKKKKFDSLFEQTTPMGTLARELTKNMVPVF